MADRRPAASGFPVARILIMAALCSGCALSPLRLSGPGAAGTNYTTQPMPDRAALKDMHDWLSAQLRAWARDDQLARENGYFYGVDLGQILIYAAQAGDRGLYEQFSPAVKAMVRDRKDDPYTRGFVSWRYRTSDPQADASGTAEALWLAHGLWQGAAAFGKPQDKALAIKILRGYKQHEYEEAGTWYIRNYFNYGTRAFATNTFMVNFNPDFLHEVARATGEAWIADLAARSRKLVLSARTPGGLVYSMIQPEVATIFPELNIQAFSPNDVVSLFEACGVAETVVASDPKLARSVLAVAGRHPRRPAYLTASRGEPYEGGYDSPFPSVCLLRLALRLKDRDLVRQELPVFYAAIREWRSRVSPPRAFTVSQFLLTTQLLFENEKYWPAEVRQVTSD
jgi:hypothetical protein